MWERQGNRRSKHAEGKDSYQPVFLQQQLRKRAHEGASADPEEIKEVIFFK
jgi:hypothetical protein